MLVKLFFQIAKTIILYWGISWGGGVPQLKLFILNKVHLSIDVNYTNHENGLKNAHLDRTILSQYIRTRGLG